MSRMLFALVVLFCVATFNVVEAGLETKIESLPTLSVPTAHTDLIALANDATLQPARYPLFVYQLGASDNDVCGLRLAANPGTVSLQPMRQNSYTVVPGMTVDVDIPLEYRERAKLLIIWTIRVEGLGELVTVWPNLCTPWHGSINQSFKGGQFYSKAKVDGRDVGTAAEMTIPDGNVLVANTASDPTHTGTALVEGPFGATVRVQIYWKNDTSLKIISKGGYRSVIVTMLL